MLWQGACAKPTRLFSRSYCTPGSRRQSRGLWAGQVNVSLCSSKCGASELCVFGERRAYCTSGPAPVPEVDLCMLADTQREQACQAVSSAQHDLQLHQIPKESPLCTWQCLIWTCSVQPTHRATCILFGLGPGRPLRLPCSCTKLVHAETMLLSRGGLVQPLSPATSAQQQAPL